MVLAKKTPVFAVDGAGTLTWEIMLRDFDKSLFLAGSKVTAEEFADLFIKTAYQANHNAESFEVFLADYFNPLKLQAQVNEDNAVTLAGRVTVNEEAITTITQDLAGLDELLDIINGVVI